MPSTTFSILALPLLAALGSAAQLPVPTAHLQARQAQSSSRASSSAAGASAPAGTATGIAAIGVSFTSEATSTMPTTVAPGATLTAVAGAPPLPSAALVVANYPALDKLPPLDSPEVKAWLAEIDLTHIPGQGPTGLGGCANTSVNAQAIANAGEGGNCWWTCGGCTRASDVSFCPTKGDWGLSFDDGPSPWTPRLLDYLTANNLKSTFFVVGSRVLSRPSMLQAEYALGHQISVHTWSHPYLTTLSNEGIVAELGWSKKVIHDTIGVTPNTFRPPYGDIDDRVRYIALQMGLTPIIWTTSNGKSYDTQDWQIAGGVVTSETVLSNFETILNANLNTGFIVLAHDLYLQSVALATEFILPQAITNAALKLKTISQCLGQAPSDAYIETSKNTTNQHSAPAGASGTGAVPGLASASVGVNAGTSAVGGKPATATDKPSSSGAAGFQVGTGVVAVMAGAWALLM